MKNIIKKIISIPLFVVSLLTIAQASPITDVIAEINKEHGGSGFSDTELENLENIFLEVGASTEYPLLFACIAGFETGGTYDAGATNKKTGCYGLMQLMRRWHKQPMIDAGLDWDDPKDQLIWSKIMVGCALNKGKSLYGALSPWSVRKSAWAKFKKYRVK
jgi:hypothetical protein